MMAEKRGLAAIVAVAMMFQVFNPHDIIGPVSIADFALIAALVAVGGYQLLTAEGFLAKGIRPLAILIGALMSWLVIAGSGWRLTQFFGFVLIICLVGLYSRSADHLEVLLWGALLGAFLAAVLTIYSATLDPEFGGRVIRSRLPAPLPPLPRTMGVPTGSFGAFSTYLLAPFPFAVLKWRQTENNWLLVPALTIFTTIILLQTRASYLALAVALSVLGVGMYGSAVWEMGWRNAGISVLVFAGGSAMALIAGWMLYTINPQNVLSRFDQFARAAELLVANPLTGVTPPILPYFPITQTIPHNVILLVGVVGGIPAMVLLLALIATSVAGLWNGWFDTPRVRLLSLSVGAGLAANLTNLSLAPGFTRAFWMLIAIGGILIFVADGQIGMLRWYRGAVANSRFASILREIVVGSRVIGAMTADATVVREQLETGWNHSHFRLLVRKFGTIIGSSTVVRLVMGG